MTFGMKGLIAAAVSVILIFAFFSGCGCVNEKNSAPKTETASAKTEETLEVIKVTPEGGTVERDSDGNTIAKDKNGSITSVKNKNGKSLDIKKYLSSHPEAWRHPSDIKASLDNKSKSSSKTSSKSNNKSKSSKNKTNNSSKNTKSSEVVEKKIPVEVGDASDDDDTVKLPDFD